MKICNYFDSSTEEIGGSPMRNTEARWGVEIQPGPFIPEERVPKMVQIPCLIIIACLNMPSFDIVDYFNK
jgi:hypothetical protein